MLFDFDSRILSEASPQLSWLVNLANSTTFFGSRREYVLW
jgi:hypothetical protein